MTVVLYFREGCPYCGRVADKIKSKKIGDKDIEIYYCDKDFSKKEFKEKYGEDATFPRGYKKTDDEVMLIGDSQSIIDYLDENY